MDEEKGIVVIWLEKVFGKSWRTSLFAFLAFASESANLVQTYLQQIGVSENVLHGGALVFGLIALLHAKDSQVTGIAKNIPPEKG
jgi:hypothetical protein